MVKCKDCQCWDKSTPENVGGRDDWGMCRRHAPWPMASPKVIWLFAFDPKMKEKDWEPSDPEKYIISGSDPKTIFPGTPETCGCWEGVPVDSGVIRYTVGVST